MVGFLCTSLEQMWDIWSLLENHWVNIVPTRQRLEVAEEGFEAEMAWWPLKSALGKQDTLKSRKVPGSLEVAEGAQKVQSWGSRHVGWDFEAEAVKQMALN